MRRAQSNSPRLPQKKYHSFELKRDMDLDQLLQLPGYKPTKPRPPSYPAHVSPIRDHLHVPRVRITCVPEPEYSEPVVMRRESPNRSPVRVSDSRGRSPARRVSQNHNLTFNLDLSKNTPLVSLSLRCF